MNTHARFDGRAVREAHPPVVLAAESLTLGYRSAAGWATAVEDVSFEVRRGERLVLLGPSGCGKSSILRAIAGFLTPAAGRIVVDGVPVRKPGPDRMVVFQEFDQLLPWKTALDNVAFPLVEARRLSRSDARVRAADALARVGLTRALMSYPHELSGGMKQRVAIARGLAMEPKVLLMDEPFAALDAMTRAKLQRDLLAIVLETDATLVFVTHSISEAALIGTELHVLSAHPGRTIGRFDVGGLDDRGRAGVVAEVEALVAAPMETIL